jgi:MFS family permease
MQNKSESDGDKSLIGNIRFVNQSKELKLLIFLIIITQAGIFFTSPIFPYFVESIHAPKLYLSTITGLLIAVVGLFNIIFAPRWGRRNDIKDYRKTLKVASLVSGTALGAQILIPHYLLLFPLRVVIGIFSAALVPTIFSAISKRLPKEKAGGVMGIASSATIFGSMSAFLLCGITASNLGMVWCFVISGLLLISVAFFTPQEKI